MSDQNKPIDVEAVPADQSQAVAVRETGGAVAQAMSIDELHRHLESIREIMRKEMKEGVDYGKIPGTGDKPGLFQPGAQKLLMTFNLTDCVKKEVLREYPNFHREYEFTITVRAVNGKEWDGVGTCSTLESKYRYRKAERRCPECGKNAIIQGKAEYGGGWVCFKKKNGCGAKFAENDQRITSQSGGTVENENPADQWNTVRKMAFKRGLVAAAINATNTSELWTQDIEDLDANAKSRPETHPPAPTPQPERKPAPRAKETPALPTQATEANRLWMIRTLKAEEGQENRRIVTEYFQKVKVGATSPLLPTEKLEDLKLCFVPYLMPQFKALSNCIANFEAGGDAVFPFEIAGSGALESEPPPKPQGQPPTTNLPNSPASATTGPSGAPTTPKTQTPPTNPEWWRKIVVPIPRKGQKRDEYLKHPDTIGSLFELRHGSDDEAQAARQRLWGFVTNYEPKPWVKRDGTEVPPSAADFKFREALDAFAEFFEREHPGEKL